MSWFKRFFHTHHFEWVRNIYGDEINSFGGKRSLWACSACGKVKALPHLVAGHDEIQSHHVCQGERP